jgi:hypothetical protein
MKLTRGWLSCLSYRSSYRLSSRVEGTSDGGVVRGGPWWSVIGDGAEVGCPYPACTPPDCHFRSCSTPMESCFSSVRISFTNSNVGPGYTAATTAARTHTHTHTHTQEKSTQLFVCRPSSTSPPPPLPCPLTHPSIRLKPRQHPPAPRVSRCGGISGVPDWPTTSHSQIAADALPGTSFLSPDDRLPL